LTNYIEMIKTIQCLNCKAVARMHRSWNGHAVTDDIN